MPHRVALALLCTVAVILWGGLIVFVNVQPPTSINQVLFLFLWGGAIACTIMPVAYLVNSRLLLAATPRRNLARAARQGALLGFVAAVLMTLQLMRVLTLVTAVTLVGVTFLVEVLIYLRSR